MIEGTSIAETRLHVAGVPEGWRREDAEDGWALVGPEHTPASPPRVVARIEPAPPEPVERVSVRLMSELQRRLPQGLVTSCDVWPHVVWGEGRYIQTAHLLDGRTMAHDVYLFVDGQARITFTVDCPLHDLLAVEEDVATIVARTIPVLRRPTA